MFSPSRSTCWRTGTVHVRPPVCSACLCVATKQNQDIHVILDFTERFAVLDAAGSSYPGHLGKVRVHVLVADLNHLSDALVVTGKTHKRTIHQRIQVEILRRKSSIEANVCNAQPPNMFFTLTRPPSSCMWKSLLHRAVCCWVTPREKKAQTTSGHPNRRRSAFQLVRVWTYSAEFVLRLGAGVHEGLGDDVQRGLHHLRHVDVEDEVRIPQDVHPKAQRQAGDVEALRSWRVLPRVCLKLLL